LGVRVYVQETSPTVDTLVNLETERSPHVCSSGHYSWILC